MAGCAVNYTQEQACEKEDLGYFDGVGGRIAANESLFAEIGGHASANATERQAIGPPCRTAEEFSRRSSASRGWISFSGGSGCSAPQPGFRKKCHELGVILTSYAVQGSVHAGLS